MYNGDQIEPEEGGEPQFSRTEKTLFFLSLCHLNSNLTKLFFVVIGPLWKECVFARVLVQESATPIYVQT